MKTQKSSPQKTTRKTKFISTSLASLCSASVLLQACGGGLAPNASSSTEGKKQTCSPATTTEDLLVGTDPETSEDVSEQGMGSRILRSRGVRVKFSALKTALEQGERQRLRLGLFDDKRVDIVVEHVDRPSADNAIIVGHIDGVPGSAATLVMKNEVLVGNISREDTGERYEVRPLGDGTHSVRALGADTIVDCQAIEADDYAAFSAEADPMANTNVGSLATTPNIDMLVAYTPNARVKQGGTDGIQALIQMGIADTNRAFSNSGVALTVRLVGTMEVSKNETSNFSSDLSALKSTTDGKWDEVHSRRRSLGADQVTLVGAYPDNSGTAGIGFIGAGSASAFTIVRASAFSQYTFSHELGHNIGLRHEDGLENTSGRFRTIMAYGSYKRIARYSNPDFPYNGYKTGDATHNSAKILSANSSRMAGLVAVSVPMPTPTPSPTPKATPVPTATPRPTATPGATPGPTPTPTPSSPEEPTPLPTPVPDAPGTENCL